MTGKNIRRIRRRKGMTQWELAVATDVRPATILLIERGAVDCPPALLDAIAGALGVETSELEREKGAKNGDLHDESERGGRQV